MILKFCEHCIQMTNHNEEFGCLKCAGEDADRQLEAVAKAAAAALKEED